MSKALSEKNITSSKQILAMRLIYLSMLGLSLCLLLMSRSDETHTIWEVLHPAFLPAFFATSFLLLWSIFSSEKVHYKLLFVIIHSIVSHSFFAIIFPAGNIGFQQVILGRTRLIFEGVIGDGWAPWPSDTILIMLYNWSRGDNFQSVLSIIFARMFSVDILWTHLFLGPFLWGIFAPLTSFLVTKRLSGDDKISVLSSLLISAFPSTIIWGAISVPNGLGFIFFFCSVYIFQRYLLSSNPKLYLLMVTLTLASLLLHPLTGIMTISLLFLVVALKSYEAEKESARRIGKIAVLSALLVSSLILPFALTSQRLIYSTYTRFGFEKLEGMSVIEVVCTLLFGINPEYYATTTLVYAMGPLVAFVGIVYLLLSKKKRIGKNFNSNMRFLVLGLLVFAINYRVLKLFMVDIPFNEERLWVFRDFLAVSFVAFAVNDAVTLVKTRSSMVKKLFVLKKVAYITAIGAIVISLSVWLTSSIYYSYPHIGPLQTTPYELEAIRSINENTTENYVVICDLWFSYAGGTIVGVENPRAFYFSDRDENGTRLFIDMKTNASNDILEQAMKILNGAPYNNNATVAYFVVEEPRLGEEEFTQVILQAQTNSLEVFDVFGDGKLFVFYYQKQN